MLKFQNHIAIVCVVSVVFSVFRMSAIINTEDVLKRNYYKNALKSNPTDTELRLRLTDSLISVAETEEEITTYRLNKVLAYINRDDYISADRSLKPLEGHSSDFSLESRLRILNYRMLIQQHMSDYSGVMHTANRILMISKPDSLRVFDFKVWLRLHTLFSSSGMPDKANHEFYKAQRWFVNHKNSLTQDQRKGYEAMLLGAAASKSQKEGDLIAAMKDCDRIMNTAQDPALRFAAMVNLADIYLSKDNPAIAIHYLEEAMKMNVDDSNRATAAIALCLALIRQKKYDRTLNVMDSVWGNRQDLLTLNQRMALDYIHATSLKETGRYEEACRFYERMFNRRDSIDQAENSMRQEILKNSLEDWTLIESYPDMRRGAEASLWILLGFLVFTCLICVTYRKRVESLKEYAVRLKPVRYGLLDKTVKDSSLIADQNDRLEESTKEASTAMMRLAQITDAFEGIGNVLRNNTLSDSGKLSEIKKSIATLQGSESLWEMFKILFMKIDRQFFDLLAQRHPELTKGELRMCGYLLLNLRTKEIAALTNRSIRTVETTKYNIRKKLNIDIPTVTYLRQFFKDTKEFPLSSC